MVLGGAGGLFEKRELQPRPFVLQFWPLFHSRYTPNDHSDNFTEL